MNYFTKISIDLANQKDYLDQLFKVYPLSPDSIRDIDPIIWENVVESFNRNDNESLIKALLSLNLFPIKDGYVPYLRKDPSAILRNPQTVNRICGRVRELGIEKLFERCSEPKETNRQMGPLFRRWIKSGVLGLFPVSEEIFDSNNKNAILDGSDANLLDYATRKLGYKRDKGVDLIARFNGKYIIGEAKFISDEGGHQNAQFNDAISTISTNSKTGVIKIGIMDGVIYIRPKRGSGTNKYKKITEKDLPIMSALVLREFLYSL
ncbi:MAG: restriction endonuclease [Bacteroidetes bacterium]|uniref:Restriction endonuclease n=1 Tax=Candidatus Caccoplasma merdipullorum TaxID=2840718 RepID=A0A9D9E634_9BACT|nr:restriction endonuclease [Candidatus Caccoplasma merdipullorum]